MLPLHVRQELPLKADHIPHHDAVYVAVYRGVRDTTCSGTHGFVLFLLEELHTSALPLASLAWVTQSRSDPN